MMNVKDTCPDGREGVLGSSPLVTIALARVTWIRLCRITMSARGYLSIMLFGRDPQLLLAFEHD